MSDTTEAAPKRGWLGRLREGLTRSSSKITDGITGIFTKRKLDDAALEELEELLISADLGPATAAKLVANLAKTRFGKEVSPEEVKGASITLHQKVMRGEELLVEAHVRVAFVSAGRAKPIPKPLRLAMKADQDSIR